MIKSLRESKARLSELVEKASRGEDVLISVRGKVKARLTRAGAPDRAADRAAWLRKLKALQSAYATGRPKVTVEQILAQDREDRA
jgi:prevent-host-death family protein